MQKEYMNVAVEYSKIKLETDLKSEVEKAVHIFMEKLKLRQIDKNIFH